MEQWNHIVQTALIGTEKKSINPADFGEDLSPLLLAVQANASIDKEEQLLQAAAFVSNYKQCGIMPLHQTNTALAVAEPEEKKYCNTKSLQVLKDILLEDSNALLELWLKQCEQNNQLVHPELLPVLLDKAVQQKHLRKLVEACIGNRGLWLSQFNKDWHFAARLSDEELWQTGSPEQRKQVLQKLRSTDIDTARTWLQQTWQQETAATKQNLLEAIEATVSKEDVPWLESLATEKSQKVKEEALRLLKKIPESNIVQLYCSVIQQSISIKKERTMLGLSSKTVLQINRQFTIDEAVFKSGIDQLSNQKEFSDEEWIIYQLLQHIPPTFLEQHLQLKPDEIVELFQKDTYFKKFFSALVDALCNFKDTRWAVAVMQYSTVFYLDILPFIPAQQQGYYSKKFFAGNENSIIQYATNWKQEWSLELTKMIFSYMASNPYQFYRNFYNQQIHLIPLQAVNILDACTPSDEYARNSWANSKEYISKLLLLKQQIYNSF